MTLLFLIGAAFLTALVYGVKSTAKTTKVLSSVTSKTKLPKSVGALMTMAQVAEFTHTVQHATIVGIIATLLLFAILLAVRSETDGEMY